VTGVGRRKGGGGGRGGVETSRGFAADAPKVAKLWGGGWEQGVSFSYSLTHFFFLPKTSATK